MKKRFNSGEDMMEIAVGCPLSRENEIRLTLGSFKWRQWDVVPSKVATKLRTPFGTLEAARF